MADSARIQADDHPAYMAYALQLAKQSPPRPTNYRVGAVLVDAATNEVLATGYTLELPGNTHAEQCCFAKLADRLGVSGEEELGKVLGTTGAGTNGRKVVLYTTMEPCSFRLSGNLPCTDRIARVGAVRTVYVGVREPDTFVENNTGRKTLEEAGVEFVHVSGLEKEIIEVATAGHTDSAAQ